jgi:GTPase SAR1 family protein
MFSNDPPGLFRKIPSILVANKCDLPRAHDLPDDTEISQFAHESGFVPKWYKTSAKSGDGKNERFAKFEHVLIKAIPSYIAKGCGLIFNLHSKERWDNLHLKENPNNDN